MMEIFAISWAMKVMKNLVWKLSAINRSECGSSTGLLCESITTVVSYKFGACKVLITAERFEVVKFWWISFKVNDGNAHKTSLSDAIPYQNHALSSEQTSWEILNVLTGVQHDPYIARAQLLPTAIGESEEGESAGGDLLMLVKKCVGMGTNPSAFTGNRST